MTGNVSAENLLRGKINGVDVIYYDTYRIAVQNGFEGTQEDWLASLGMVSFILLSGDPLKLNDSSYFDIKEKFWSGKTITLYRYVKTDNGEVIRYYHCYGKDNENGNDVFVFRYVGEEVETIRVSVKATPTGAEDIITISTDAKVINVTIEDGRANYTAAELKAYKDQGYSIYWGGLEASSISDWEVVFEENFYSGYEGSDGNPYAYCMTRTVIGENGGVSESLKNLPTLNDNETTKYNTWSGKKIAEEIAKGGGNGTKMLVANITHNEDGEISCDVDPSQIRAALNSPNKAVKIVVNQQINGKRLFEPSVSVDLDGNISLYFADCRYEYDEITQSGWYYHSTVLPNGDEVSY